MDTQEYDLILAYEGSPYSFETSKAFQNEVAADGLNLALKELPLIRAFAGVEWFMPTAIMLFVCKAYFDGFLGEAGKDHYGALKRGVKLLADKVGQRTVTRIGTPGKLSPTQPYSLSLSIWFQRDDDTNFKFLIPVGLSSDETEVAMEVFFAFLEGWHAGTMDSRERQRFESAEARGRTLLLAYSPETKRIELIDPFEGRLG